MTEDREFTTVEGRIMKSPGFWAAKDLGMLFYIFFVIADLALAGEIPTSMQKEKFVFWAPDGYHTMSLISSDERIILEQTCASRDNWEASTDYLGNTLEVGFGVTLSRKIPAKTYLYTRYTCPRPVAWP